MIKVNRSALSAALDSAVAITKSKSAMAILRNVSLVSHGDSLTISATNLETSIVRSVRCAGDQFGTLVPCAEFAKIVASLDGDEIELRFDGAKLELKVGSGRSAYTFKCMPIDDFPTLPRVAGDQGGRSFDIDAAKLAEAFERTRSFVETESSRYALAGIQLTPKAGSLKVCGANEHRGSVVRFDSPEVKASDPVVVSAESVAVALPNLRNAGSDGPATVALSDKHWSVAVGAVMVIGRVIEGQFPDIEQFIPKKHDGKATVSRPEMIAACQRLAALRGDSLALRIEKSDGDALSISYTSLDVGNGVESVDAEIAGTIDALAWKSYYLIDTMNAARTAKVRIEFAAQTAGFHEVDPAPGLTWSAVVAGVRK